MNKKKSKDIKPSVTIVKVTEEEIYNYELLVNEGGIEGVEVEDMMAGRKRKRVRDLAFMINSKGEYYCRANKKQVKKLKTVLDGFRVKGRKLAKIPNRRRPPLAESVEVKEKDTGTKKKKG